MTTTRIASDGKLIEVTNTPAGLSENSGVKTSIVQPVMARDLSRAGTEIYVAPLLQAHLRRGRLLCQAGEVPHP